MNSVLCVPLSYNSDQIYNTIIKNCVSLSIVSKYKLRQLQFDGINVSVNRVLARFSQIKYIVILMRLIDNTLLCRIKIKNIVQKFYCSSLWKCTYYCF